MSCIDFYDLGATWEYLIEHLDHHLTVEAVRPQPDKPFDFIDVRCLDCDVYIYTQNAPLNDTTDPPGDLQTYDIEVERTGYSTRVFQVPAHTRRRAEELAIILAMDSVFSERGSDYRVL